MSPNVFSYIFRYSKKEQIILLVVTALSFPFLYLSLDLPKTIINKAIGGTDFPKEFLGYEVEQIPYLLILCGFFLALVFINGGFKFYVNVFRGVVGERMLRRLRYTLIARVMRFPLPHFRRTSQGEIVSMITTETEPLGGFIGDAYAMPAFQGGTLVTIVCFMFIQDWVMGLAAISLYPIQAYLIPKLQRQVNLLGKERVHNARKLSERIGETVSGAHEIHAHDTSQYELADYGDRLGILFAIRVKIYRKKFFIKFVNNFLAQLTPFLFFSIGGYLVITADFSFGALVAVLAAYKDMTAPWKELLAYYQRMEDARIKYDQLIEQFQPAGMLDEDLLASEPGDGGTLDGELTASNVSWEEDEGTKVVSGASLNVTLPTHMAIVGAGGSGKDEFARLLARQLVPSSGRIDIGGRNLIELPESVTGRQIGYVGQEAYIASGTVRDGLLYGLKHRPLGEATYDDETRNTRHTELEEAARAGNSSHDLLADWVDYEAAGGTGPDDLSERVDEILRVVEFEEDIFQIGLRRTIDAAGQPETVDKILEARALLQERLSAPDVASLVEAFDEGQYNANASVAENILFGTPVGPTFAIENLGENAYVFQVLEKMELSKDFLSKGFKLAEMMVEIFHDLPPGHEFFERFSFVSSDDLPEFQAMLRRVENTGLDGAGETDVAMLMALPFKLVLARHHLDLIDDAMQERLLEARRVFAQGLPEDLKPAVQFFDRDAYNAASSIQDNILFGKMASEKAQSGARVGKEIAEVIEELGLQRTVIETGLSYEVGIGGSRLSPAQRQKLALARCLMKRPDVVIVNEALSSLDKDSRDAIFTRVKEGISERSLIWIDSQDGTEKDDRFQQVFAAESGRIIPLGEAASAERLDVAETLDEEAPAAATGLGAEVEVLAKIPLFAGMDRSKLKFLAFTSERLSFDAGEVLLRQGEVGDKAFIIVEGMAEVVLETDEGDKRLAMIGKNELFGELALLCDAPRTATVRGETPLTVLGISKELFVRLIEDDAEVSANVTRAVAARLEGTLREYGKTSTMYSATTKLATYSLLDDRFRQAKAHKKRHGNMSALLTFDFDHLADGDAGNNDEILKQAGERIRACLREMDTVALLQETEFAILVNEIESDADPAHVARRMAEALAKPFIVGAHEIMLGKKFRFNMNAFEDEDLDLALDLCRQGKSKSLTVEL